jgi:hypothetical protein
MSDPYKTQAREVAHSARMSEHELRALPNVGPAVARMLVRIGVDGEADLRGRDPAELYGRVCESAGARQDVCLLDTFAAIVDHAGGAPARPWWEYSRERKRREKEIRR